MLPRLVLLATILLPLGAQAQGFAGLGAAVEGYDAVTPAAALTFPEDHGAHPGHRIEWWYVTANLSGPDGAPLGIQFTIFRQASDPPPEREGWANQQYWLGHAALTTRDTHRFATRLARGGSGQAGARAAPFAVWLDAWEMAGALDGAATLRAEADDFAYDLTLQANGPFILHGEAGFSRKSDRGQASYYYSQPHFTVTGRVTLDGAEMPVTGRAWMDREWSSQPLEADQTGWDWFSLRLGADAMLMAFRLRDREGGAFLSGTWIEDGQATALPGAAITLDPLAETDVDGRMIPTEWRVAVPERGVDVTVSALNPLAWNASGFAYWEGPVDVSGSHTGDGYLEMTGYEAALD